MAYIQERTDDKGNTRYRVQVRLKGYPLQTATFDRKTDAKKWAQATETAMREKRYFKTAESCKHMLADLVDRYIRDVLPTKPKSEEKQKAQLEWWKAEIGSYTLADVTPALISEKRDQLLQGTTRRNTQRSPSTVVRYLAVLSHAFTVAVQEWGWIDDSPLRKVRKPKEARGRVRFLNDKERAALLEACKESESKLLYPIVVLALSTGMRRTEICTLTWQDIHLQDGYLVLQETKNGERRRVHLTGHALEEIKKLKKVQRIDTPYVFPHPHLKKQPMDIRTPWEKALAAAGIEDFRFHDLRHCCASYLAMNGASLSEIAEVLGHKTLAMVKRYAHLSEAHTSKVVESMNKRIFG